MKKPETIIIDLDGTILAHHERGAVYQWDPCTVQLLPGVHEFFDLIEKQSACIVLMTARKPSCREETETMLKAKGLFWDHLIMGVTSGHRVIINDAKINGEHGCTAYSIERNKGFEELCQRFQNASV